MPFVVYGKEPTRANPKEENKEPKKPDSQMIGRGLIVEKSPEETRYKKDFYDVWFEGTQ